LTLDDLATDAEKNGVSRKDIARNYRFIVREFDLKIPVPVNKMYSSKIGNKIQGSPQTEILATRILDVAKGMKLTGGRSPTGIAAAAYYMASVLRNDHRTQKEIAEVANVTEVTIRNRYKELMEKLFIGVPV
jgi:transcription initiation factor TFIIB